MPHDPLIWETAGRALVPSTCSMPIKGGLKLLARLFLSGKKKTASSSPAVESRLPVFRGVKV